MRYRGIREYESLEPLGANRLWSAFVARADDHSVVELRALTTSHEKSASARLIQRLQLISVAKHAAIRSVIEVVPQFDPPFCIVEFISGQNLSQQSTGRPTDLRQFLQTGVQLTEALAEIHRCGIVVGNITPDIVFERNPSDWVIDLTLAGDHSDRGDVERSEFTELKGGEPEDDVAALCLVLSQLKPATSPQSHFGLVANGLTDLLERGSQTDPAQRPTAVELANSFRSLLSAMEGHDDRFASRQPQATMVSQEGLLAQTLLPESQPVSCGVSVPEVLGRFRLHERLGEGAVGAVFRATDPGDGATVAIKVLNSQLARDPKTLRRFAKEARMLSSLQSAFIARLLDSNSDQDFHFLAMEYVSGGTLSSLIRGGRQVPERIALRLILDAVKGLAVAHQQGVFHRDVKPDNILLTSEGRAYAEKEETSDVMLLESVPLAKISDFGLARAEQQTDSLAITHDGAILGTPLYMSPEQCRGLAADARSDVYALGVTLFQFLSGRVPFPGDNHIAVMNAHCNDPLPSLARLCPHISESCVSVVEKCLARNPDARYFDALALQTDIERLLHGQSTSMQLHPAAPSSHANDVLEFYFTCDLAASPTQLWPYVSNTDRVNYSMGLGSVNYTTRSHPLRGVERFAEARVAGQRLVWQEHPYEWVEGRRLSVLREFSLGPFQWFMNIVDLSPASGGGTRLTQTFKVVPRHWLGRILAKLVLGRSTPTSFRRVYEQIDRYLSKPDSSATASPFTATTAISPSGRSILRDRLARLAENRLNPKAIETLGQFLEHASDQEVARIRPLVFAERFKLPPRDVVDCCLLSAKAGLLTLLWDILCPSCRIPADVQETLASLRDHAYCPACDLQYQVDFANSVELIFRAHPEVRSAETRTYCIGGPAFSAHVVAQIRLAAGERFQLELALNEGTYRVRGPQLPFAIDLRVSAANGVTYLELPLVRPPTAGSVPLLRQGNQVLVLYNDTPRELQIRVERTAGRAMALTAAAAAAIPMFREMFPGEVLAPGQIVSVTSVSLLMAEVCASGDLYRRLGDGPAFQKVRGQLQQMEETVRASGGAVVKFVGEGLMATFNSTNAALNAGVEMLRSPPDNDVLLRLSLHRGPAMVTTINDRLDYFGETVHVARSLLQSAQPGELIAVAAILDQEDLKSSLRDKGVIMRIAGLTIDESANICCRCRIPATS